MILENFHRFIFEKRTILIKVQERILLFRYAECEVFIIRAILKEEFSDIVTWIYNDLYNFIYQKREFDVNNFIKELKYLKS